MAYNNFNRSNQQPKQSAADRYKNYEYGIKVTVVPKVYGGAAGVVKKGFARKGQPAPQVAAPQAASTEPEVKCFLINLYNLQQGDAKAIEQRLTSNPNKVTYKVWVNAGDNSNLSIVIKQSDLDAWMQNDMNSIQAVLLQSQNNYDNNMVMHLKDQIDTACRSNDSADNANIIANAEKTIAQMWSEYLSKVNDPTMMARIKLYSKVYENLNKIYGHVLSMANVDLIRSVNKDATFILTKNSWETMFGRGVKAGATKHPYWTPVSSSMSQSKFNDIKSNSIWQNDTNLSPQVRRAMELAASEGIDGQFRIVVGYDVKDTYLLDGSKEDKFNTTIGYLNNLTGELNSVAKQHKDNIEAQAQVNDPAKDSKQVLMEKRTKMALDHMVSTAQEKGIRVSQTGSDANDLRDMVYDYCKILATTRAKHLKPNTTDVYAENATKVSLIITELALPSLTKYNTTYKYSPEEAADLMTVVYKVVKELEEATTSTVNEGIGSWLMNKAEFVKKFMKTLKMIGCSVLRKNNNTNDMNSQSQESNNTQTPEMIKENFYRIFNKINKDIF